MIEHYNFNNIYFMIYCNKLEIYIYFCVTQDFHLFLTCVSTCITISPFSQKSIFFNTDVVDFLNNHVLPILKNGTKI